MRFVIGVDGGGSKTHAVVMDEKGKKLGEGVSGCGNHQFGGIEQAIAHINEAVELALQEAGLPPQAVDYVMFGLAGADREYDFNILRPALAALPYANWDVVCDTMEGLRIGSRDNQGVILVCGSGTNAAGRNAKGETIQTGGFGYLYGDAAGGGAMAQETFRAAVRSWEQREIPSVLTELVPRYFGQESMEALVNDCLDKEMGVVPSDLTIVLHQAADQGDELAIRLLKETGRELGLAGLSVIRRLGGFEGGTIPIVLVGSVLQQGRNPHLLQALLDVLEQDGQSVELVIPDMAPVYGAVMLAMDRMGIPVTEDMKYTFTTYGGYKG
ncbi:N-acetylglucosamine kinase [Paenibacillus abyssi]|uniref:Kinase n=1 Tax=Paenibacillus abyssi TaxID=1340531 RepID=A0A917LGS3_9BACL|nr:BadF/BadG/BcrA/BcrD ATPase family protein [Paenibacillus abyssi]GGG21940.1 kinase [Paenibacillus abyssi]